MGLLEGKTALIFGVLTEDSLAWGIAEAFAREGCELGFSHLPGQKRRVGRCVKDLNPKYLEPCDVRKDNDIAYAFARAKEVYGSIDILVHSIAFAGRETFDAPFHETTREQFHTALDISAYSLIALARGALPIMNEGGSIVTLSYVASEKYFPKYNVMAVAKAALECNVRYLAGELGHEKKIRVNAISAGPIKTLAAMGIKGFSQILSHSTRKSPLQHSHSRKTVGEAALFLCSDMGRATTGHVLYSDSGYNVVGW